MQANRIIKIALLVIFILGTIVPFVDYLVVIEVFYLRIPFALLFLGSAALAIGCLMLRSEKSSTVLLFCLVVPTLIGAQTLAAFTVHKVQRFRADQLISTIESVGMITESIRNSAQLGIRLNESEDGTFEISYARGFLVREVYDSQSRSWKSYDWND